MYNFLRRILLELTKYFLFAERKKKKLFGKVIGCQRWVIRRDELLGVPSKAVSIDRQLIKQPNLT